MEEEEDDFGSTPDFKLIKHEPFGRTWERIYLLFRFASITIGYFHSWFRSLFAQDEYFGTLSALTAEKLI